jgi:hypothetical protein
VVKSDDVYEIEKILKTRERGGKVAYNVKFKGYPEKFNSWVMEVFKPRKPFLHNTAVGQFGRLLSEQHGCACRHEIARAHSSRRR